MAGVPIPTLDNRAISGYLEGVWTQRLNLDDAPGRSLGNTLGFAQEFEEAVATAVAAATLPTPMTVLTSAASTTQVVATHLQANAAESLPPVFGALAKAALDLRSAYPTESVSQGGGPFDAADFGPLASSLVALMVSFAGSALYCYDNNSAIQNPVLYNCAAGGFLAGVYAARLSTLNTIFEPVEASDFDDEVTAAFTFAAAVDAAITSASGVPTNVTSLTTNGEPSVTVVPGTAAVANAAQSLPAAMVYICKAAWNMRSQLPQEPDGTPYTTDDYAFAANSVTALFLEYAAHTDNS